MLRKVEKEIPESAAITQAQILEMTSGIVVAYLNKNAANASDVSHVIDNVHEALQRLAASGVTDQNVLTKQQEFANQAPSIAVKKSITPDYIICLEDGKRLKTLKRYLFGRYGLTPDEYRNKWNLPPDYPMVAPNYAAKRSRLARESGLGHTRRKSRRAKAKKAR